ncbi:MAG: DUF4255 domain-containing protein [Thermodesulfobacteriota bacterium]
MASFRGVFACLQALQDLLTPRIEADLGTILDHPRVTLLGSRDLRNAPTGNALGIYLHRISVDPIGRNRHLQPARPSQPARPELPVNLHILLLGWCAGAAAEATVVAWAMQQIASFPVLDASHLAPLDPFWGSQDTIQIIPEEMPTEDLMRIWDSIRHEYVLSSPCLVKSIRLEPAALPVAGPPVRTVLVPVGEV